MIRYAGVLNGYKVDRKKKKPEAAENISAGLSVNLTNKLGLGCQHLTTDSGSSLLYSFDSYEIHRENFEARTKSQWIALSCVTQGGSLVVLCVAYCVTQGGSHSPLCGSHPLMYVALECL